MSVIVAFPAATRAQLVISEFLYDSEGSDTDKEYVEIFNAGSAAVDLTKWKINDGSNHGLNVPPKNGGTGSITIAPGDYALFVDNAVNFIASHPGISASIIDSVLSLTNAAGTISLINEDGTVADSVSYTKGEGGAGDGNSLHRGSAGGAVFSAGSPSPGTGNLSAAPNAGGGDSTAAAPTTTSGVSATGAVSSYVPPPSVRLFADAGSDRVVIVGADVEFRGRAYNRDKEIIENVRFSWNFGDGSHAEGQSVLHHFDFPGRYAVVLTIAEHVEAASDKIIVTAESAQLAFSALSDGSVAIGNLSGRDIDVSNWIVSSSGKHFILPAESIILAEETLRLSAHTLGFSGTSETTLSYPNGAVAREAESQTEHALPTLAPSTEGATEAEKKEPLASGAIANAKLPAAPKKTSAPVAAMSEENDEDAERGANVDNESVPMSATSSLAAAGAAESSGYVWWLSALSLAALGAGAVYAVKRVGNRESFGIAHDKWDIIEESTEEG